MRHPGQVGGGNGLGNPGILPGVRATPAYHPVPNSEPAGARTGAPPRTRMYSRPVAPQTADEPTILVDGTPENRIVSITPPDVGFTVYIGEAGIKSGNGLALPSGRTTEIPLPGLQAIYAVTDAPVYVRVGVMICIVLAAEQQRKTDGL